MAIANPYVPEDAWDANKAVEEEIPLDDVKIEKIPDPNAKKPNEYWDNLTSRPRIW